MTRTAEFDGWCIVTGQDFREKIFIKDPFLPKIANPNHDPSLPEDPVTNSLEIYQPKDLTGYAAKMEIRDKKGHNSPASVLIASLTDGFGITIGSPDPADGSVEIFIDNSTTDSQPIIDNIGEAHYDLFLIPPAPGDNQRIVFGTIKILDATTDV